MIERESFNNDLCTILEYHITRILATTDNQSLIGFWCDGVLMPSENQIVKKKVNDCKKIETTAWSGISGQDQFKLIIHFGKYSLRRYAKGRKLNDCLNESPCNLKVDTIKKQIELHLK